MDPEERSILENVLWRSGNETQEELTEYLDDSFDPLPPLESIDEDKHTSCFYFMELEYNGLCLTPERADKVRNTTGSTPLIRACYHGYTDIVVKLLDEYHVDIEEMGSIRETITSSSRKNHLNEPPDLVRPLYSAVYGSCKSLAIFYELFERKASVNETSSDGETALHAACFKGRLDVVECLVSRGADLQLVDDNDFTCIMHAARGGSVDVAQYLARKGQDVNQKNKNDLCALDLNAMSCSSGSEYFVSCSNVESFHEALNLAAAYKNSNFVSAGMQQKRCSLKQEVDAFLLLGSSFLDIKTTFFFSTLEGYNRKEHVEQCLQKFKLAMAVKWKDIRKYDECREAEETERFTALPTREIERLRDVELLGEDLHVILKQCLLIQGRTIGPDNPIFFRTYSASVRTLTPVECLHLNIYALLKVNNKFETNHKCYNFYASSLVSTLDTISLDLAVPYTAELIMIFSNTISHFDSFLQQRKRNADIMENFGSNIHKILLFIQFFIAIRKRLTPPRLARIKSLVERFVRWKPSFCNGRSPMHYIFLENSYKCDVFKFLLRRGADINALDNENNTPLHILAKNPDSNVSVKMFLKYGAHIDARNTSKETPLQLMPSDTLSSSDVFNYMTLKCLCAHVLKDSGSPHLDRLPKLLKKFVNSH